MDHGRRQHEWFLGYHDFVRRVGDGGGFLDLNEEIASLNPVELCHDQVRGLMQSALAREKHGIGTYLRDEFVWRVDYFIQTQSTRDLQLALGPDQASKVYTGRVAC